MNLTQSILLIIQTALTALSAVPQTAAGAAVAEGFTQILVAGLNAYHTATGAPLDLTKIPLETPVS